MNCPKCKHLIPDKLIAKHLASKGGKAKKNYSKKEKKLRAERLAVVRLKRWEKLYNGTTNI